jgi:hypothetical protein
VYPERLRSNPAFQSSRHRELDRSIDAEVDVYIGTGVLAVIIIALLLIWLF